MQPPIEFLSYSREDLEEIGAIAKILKIHGIRTWQDINNLGAGLSEDRVRSAIRSESSGFLFYSTTRSVSSLFVRKVELPEAEGRQRSDCSFKIVPIFGLSIRETDAALADSLTVPISNFNGAKVEPPADRHSLIAAARRAAEIVLQDLVIEKDTSTVCLGLASKQKVSASIALDLDFSPFFLGGLPSSDDWNEQFPAALGTVKNALVQRSLGRVRLYAYAHLSLGVLFGYVFRDRTGFQLEMEQTDKAKGKTIWTSDGDPAEHHLSMRALPGVLDSQNLIVKMNLVADDALSIASFAKETGLCYRAILDVAPAEYPCMISNGQAIAIARQLTEKIKKLHGIYGTNNVHLFAAIPLGLAVLIGYNLNACGTVQCYEFDNSLRQYHPSCLLR